MAEAEVAVAAATGAQQRLACALAGRLGLPLVPAAGWHSGLLLLVTPDRLELQPCGPGAAGSTYVDFEAGRAAHRRHFGGGTGQPLVRAVGLKRGWRPRVLDATAGMGRDAFVLATLGCELTLLERSPVIWALLQDGVQRAQRSPDPELAEIAGRMEVRYTDAAEVLGEAGGCGQPDVIYLDPMYPKRRKSAQVKKEMRLFRELVGGDRDADRLLQLALERAGYRVVVKRPARAGCLAGIPPSMTIDSPNTRYDVYVRKGSGRGRGE